MRSPRPTRFRRRSARSLAPSRAARLGAGEGRHEDVLQDRALRQEIVRLEDETNLTVPHGGELLIVQGAQVLAIERD